MSAEIPWHLQAQEQTFLNERTFRMRLSGDKSDEGRSYPCSQILGLGMAAWPVVSKHVELERPLLTQGRILDIGADKAKVPQPCS